MSVTVITIEAPDWATPNSHVPVTIRVKNTHNVSQSIDASAEANGKFLSGIKKVEIPPGKEAIFFTGGFTMPNVNVLITVITYWIDELGEYWFDSEATKMVSLEKPEKYYYISLAISLGGSVQFLPVPSKFENGLPHWLEGTVVKLVATPWKDYRFVRWSGDVAGESNTISVKMTKNYIIKAEFESIIPKTFYLDIKVVSLGGVIEPGPGDYQAYSTVNLVARPVPGYRFVRWGGDASGTNLIYNLYMGSDKYVEAYFEAAPVPKEPQFRELKVSLSAGG